EAARIGEKAIALAREVGEGARSIEAHALCTVGVANAWGAAGDEGVRQLQAALELARELDDPGVAFRASVNLSTALALFGRRDEAIEVTRAAIERARADRLEGA